MAAGSKGRELAFCDSLRRLCRAVTDRIVLSKMDSIHPRPAVNVDVGVPSVAPSTHAVRAVASGEVDVAYEGTHAAGGVAASEWLAANMIRDDVKLAQLVRARDC